MGIKGEEEARQSLTITMASHARWRHLLSVLLQVLSLLLVLLQLLGLVGRSSECPASEEHNIAGPHSLHHQEISFVVKHPVRSGIQPEETQNSFLGLKKPNSPFQD